MNADQMCSDVGIDVKRSHSSVCGELGSLRVDNPKKFGIDNRCQDFDIHFSGNETN